jgi:RNA 2',3'-cyclic 3'-phosphodiesterase
MGWVNGYQWVWIKEMGYNMGMRIFVGLPISEIIRGEVLEWENKLKTPTTPSREARHPALSAGGEMGARWIEPKNLHITLVPPSVESSGGLRPLIEKLDGIKFEPFEIKFDQITFGPDERRPRMIWALGDTGKEIGQLKKLIEISLGQKPYDRPFRPHMTLARFKELPLAPSFAKRGELERIDWRQTIASFALYESRLSSDGADYRILEEFKLLK